MVTPHRPVGKTFFLVGMFFLLAFSLLPVVEADKIISHYSFNTTGAKEFKDSTSRYNLTNSGGTTPAGFLGTGFYADNAGDFANVTKPTLLGGGAHYSVCGWMKYVSGDGINIYGGGAATKRPLEMLYYNSSKVVYGIADTGAGQAYIYSGLANFPTTLARIKSSYNYYCIVYDGTLSNTTNKMKLYFNGSKVNTISYSGVIPATTTTPLTTGSIGGKEQSVPVTNGVGYVDEVTVFNVSLTAANITWLYNSGAGRPYNVIYANFGGVIPPAVTNFSISTYSYYTGGLISGFNYTINGVDYSSISSTQETVFPRSSTLKNITVSKAGFITREYLNYNISSNLAAYLYPNNSLSIRAKYTNGTTINTFTARIYNLTNQTSKTVTIGYANFTNLGTGSWNIEVNKTGSAKAYYTVTMGNNNQQLIAYLVRNTTTLLNTTFTVKDKQTGNYLEGAVISQYLLISGTLTLINSMSTDVVGSSLVRYAPLILYKFEISKTGYTTKTFYLQPSSSTYIILLDQSDAFNPNIVSNDVSVTIQDYLMKQKNLSWVTVSFSSGEGSLTSYAVSLVSDHNQTLKTGNNAYGSVLNATIRENVGRTVVVRFCYNSTLNVGENCGNIVYRLQRVQQNIYDDLEDDSTGLEAGEKVLIATFVTILIAGAMAVAFALIGASGIGAAIGVMVGMGVFYSADYIGFWSFLLICVMMVMFIANRAGTDG